MNLYVWKIHSDSLEVEKEVKASIRSPIHRVLISPSP